MEAESVLAPAIEGSTAGGFPGVHVMVASHRNLIACRSTPAAPRRCVAIEKAGLKSGFGEGHLGCMYEWELYCVVMVNMGHLPVVEGQREADSGVVAERKEVDALVVSACNSTYWAVLATNLVHFPRKLFDSKREACLVFHLSVTQSRSCRKKGYR